MSKIVPFAKQRKFRVVNPKFMTEKRENKNVALFNIGRPDKRRTVKKGLLRVKQRFRVVFVFLKLLREVREKRQAERDNDLNDFTKNFKIYREATSVWAVNATKRTIDKLISDVDGSLHYNSHLHSKFVDFDEKEHRISLVKSLAEDIIIDLDEETRHSKINPDILIFFSNFIEPNSHIPNNFFTKFELDRVVIDSAGMLSNVSDD